MNYQDWQNRLKAGERITRKVFGSSMRPKIFSGQIVVIEPITPTTKIEKGDVVFCKVGGNYYVHKVYAIKEKKGKLQYCIGNNHGHINGWTKHIFGKVVQVV